MSGLKNQLGFFYFDCNGTCDSYGLGAVLMGLLMHLFVAQKTTHNSTQAF